ncbi:bifunctional phosphoglucose/phosphomannose isomerase [soil metagenome]
MNLDNRSFVTELDPHGMLDHTEGFPDQCRKALEIAKGVKVPTLENRPSVCALTGMGGSAAGGDFVHSLFEAHGGSPFVVTRDYHIPNYIGLGDLVFCASYSGNTEETLSCYAEAKAAGARVIAITSGGKLAEQAEADGHTVCIVPGGQPPRTALGWMLIPVIYFCQELKLIPEQDFEKCFALLDSIVKQFSVGGTNELAKDIATDLHGAVPIIYGLGTWQGLIANRWRSQINENAKQLAFFNSYPELNHNEILGWVNAPKMGVSKFVGIRLEGDDISPKMAKRAEVTERLVKDAAKFHVVQAQGDTLLEKMLTLAYIGDFVSIFLARLNGVDPESIDSINTLKEELGKVK